jgi:phosphoribosylglycinamide formyltransferase-1
MRILSEEFTHQYRGRMINLHPALLPLHKGLDTYNRSLQAGDRETGASIHYVTAGLDSGPVITQVKIPILPGDDAASLKARLGPLEHRLLVATVDLFSKRQLDYEHDTVLYQGRRLRQPLLLQPDGSFS